MAGSPFDWQGKASGFARDSRFTANSKGLSKSQRATKTVQQRKDEQGWSPGVIWGLSAKADQQLIVRPKKGGRG